MNSRSNILHAAVGVINNTTNEVLISKRDQNAHQGGLWEFPGGKVEVGESVREALTRELHEELGIFVTSASPLIKIRYSYPDVTVLLDVWRVDGFKGQARGSEGQTIAWVPEDQLTSYSFPAANIPIISAARLPEYYAILDDSTGNLKTLKRNFDCLIANQLKLVRLRAQLLPERQYRELATWACKRAEKADVKVLLNNQAELALELGVAGIHLDSRSLMSATVRPMRRDAWVCASCHNAEELTQAEKMGVDFVVLGPVLTTLSHPRAENFGWGEFENMVNNTRLPVYGLGGLARSDLNQVQSVGGQGVAGIRAFINR